MTRHSRRGLRRLGCITGHVAVLGVAAASASRARAHSVGTLEARVFRTFNDRTDRLAAPVWAVMQSGSLGAVFVAAAVTARRRGAHHAGLVAVVGTSVWIGAKALKPAVGRGRPDRYLDGVVVRGAPQSGLGYPSGHAAVALTLALMTPVALGAPDQLPGRMGALGLAGATGAARMYVGAHLPLDVVGGLAIGAGAGRIGSMLLRRR